MPKVHRIQAKDAGALKTEAGWKEDKAYASTIKTENVREKIF